MKFFGLSFGASIYLKEDQEGIMTTKICGIYSEKNLIECFITFLIKYVLCSECASPRISFNENGDLLEGTCSFCGNRKVFDSQDKMIRYILKNPTKYTRFKED